MRQAPTLIPRPLPLEPAMRAEPEPVVHITIGRVEVRANVAPAAAPRADHQPAEHRVMPLEEYLDRRAGGGRL